MFVYLMKIYQTISKIGRVKDHEHLDMESTTDRGQGSTNAC